MPADQPRALFLRPWYTFTCEGHEYVVNSRRMIARRVEPGFTATLERIAADPLAPRRTKDELELFRLELVRHATVVEVDTGGRRPATSGRRPPGSGGRTWRLRRRSSR